MIQITAQRVETSSSYIRWTLCISSFFPERAVVFVSVVYPAFPLTARHYRNAAPKRPPVYRTPNPLLRRSRLRLTHALVIKILLD